jgi:D-alanine-D-alanine ligase
MSAGARARAEDTEDAEDTEVSPEPARTEPDRPNSDRPNSDKPNLGRPNSDKLNSDKPGAGAPSVGRHASGWPSPNRPSANCSGAEYPSAYCSGAESPKAETPDREDSNADGRTFLAGLDVAILHDPVPEDAPPDRQDTLIQARDVAQALARLGMAPRLVSFGPDLDAMRRELSAPLPRLAVNLVESLAGFEQLAFAAPALLTALGIPFTGCGAQALLAASGKSAAKRLLRRAGLSTPDWLSQAPQPGDPTLAFPPSTLFIIKPEHTHGSVGIGEGAVVSAQSPSHLARLLDERAQALGQPCLAEAFVAGREFSLAVLAGPAGPEALPPAEMGFFGPGAEHTRVLTYASKWEEGSAAYAETRRAFPAGEPELLARLAEAALAAWRIFGLAGYARLDFRVGPAAGLETSGAPQIIDVNANPCLAEDAGLAAAARQAGLDYDALMARIVQAALGWPGQGKQGTSRNNAQCPGDDAPRWRTQVLPGDPEAVRRLVESTGFFNAEEIVIAGELVQEHLAKGDASGYFYVFAEECAPLQDGCAPDNRASDAIDGGAIGKTVEKMDDKSNGAEQCGLAGYACFGPTPGTADSFDLYWIAVDPRTQGKGLGGAILARAEAEMAERGARGIYVETSSRGQYLPTRRFYEKHGYVACARLDGFYQTGDDKIIYNKRLF